MRVTRSSRRPNGRIISSSREDRKEARPARHMKTVGEPRPSRQNSGRSRAAPNRREITAANRKAHIGKSRSRSNSGAVVKNAGYHSRKSSPASHRVKVPVPVNGVAEKRNGDKIRLTPKC
ncbi:hypothetical protein TRIP_C21669 [Candidatus Zixiibacteriota bacterium]|nr:hypothetical protein TRIP_C21669 [candidate division Zixibacteria bacterium]